MPITVPWHAAGAAHYHNNTDCRIAAAQPAGRREGSGGKRICLECERRNRALRATLHSQIALHFPLSGPLRRPKA